MSRAKTPPHSPEVDEWFTASDHPLGAVMHLVRDAVLRSDSRVTECFKWKRPTFVYDGNIASIDPRAERFVQLMSHRGADIPCDFPNLVGGNGRRST